MGKQEEKKPDLDSLKSEQWALENHTQSNETVARIVHLSRDYISVNSYHFSVRSDHGRPSIGTGPLKSA